MERLFVYGSLGPGRENEHVLAKLGGTWKKGFVMGKRFSEGWGAGLGYQGVRLDEKLERIDGFLFSSSGLDEFWKELDAFEGKEYKRMKTMVKVEGEPVEIEAFIYILA